MSLSIPLCLFLISHRTVLQWVSQTLANDREAAAPGAQPPAGRPGQRSRAAEPGMAAERQPSLWVSPSAGCGAWGAVNVPQGSEVISRGGHSGKPLWCCEAPGRVLHRERLPGLRPKPGGRSSQGKRPSAPGNLPPAEHAPGLWRGLTQRPRNLRAGRPRQPGEEGPSP